MNFMLLYLAIYETLLQKTCFCRRKVFSFYIEQVSGCCNRGNHMDCICRDILCMYVCLLFSLHLWRATPRTHKLELLYTHGTR